MRDEAHYGLWDEELVIELFTMLDKQRQLARFLNPASTCYLFTIHHVLPEVWSSPFFSLISYG